MNRQTNKHAWLLLSLVCSITAHGACQSTPSNQGIREIIVNTIIPATCESTSILDTCCTTIANDFRSTWTVLERIESKADNLCSPCQATPITAAQTISNAGTYCLEQDIAGDITISAPNVTLDLNGHTIAGSTNGIFINSAGDNAWVKNGTVNGASESGIKINAPRCVIEAIDVIDTPTGFLLENASTSKINHCRALNNTSAGFSLASSSNNTIRNCQALNQLGSATVYGFYANNGSSNIFETCQALGAKTLATDAQYLAGGFILGETAVNDSIIGCQVADIQAPGLAQALGIASRAAQAISDVLITNGGVTLNSIDWSPDGLYFAFADTHNILRLFSFDGSTLTLKDSVPLGGPISKIAWQPGNTSPYRIAVAVGSNTLSIVSFDGSTYTLNSTSVSGISILAWSADGSYVAVNGTFLGTPTVAVYDSTLVFVAASTDFLSVTALSWQPGQTSPYIIAVGDTNSSTVKRYSFVGARITNTFTDFPIFFAGSLSWAPNGTYLAVAGLNLGQWQLDILDTGFNPLASQPFGSTQLTQVAWASDNTTLALANQAGDIGLFSFVNPILTLDETKVYGAQVNSVAWPQSGAFTSDLAIGGFATTGGYVGCIYIQAEISISNHTVENNVVRGVRNTGFSGIGIRVPSTTNYVAQNTSCDNDTNYASVDTLFLKSQANARGVANVDCSLANIPEPITADFSTTYTMLAAVSKETWSIESKAEVISSKIDFIPAQQPIERGTVIRTPLASQAITQPGSYFLQEDIVGTVTISSDLVTLDLNGFTVQGNIRIDPAVHNIVIKRGTVSTDNARASIAIAGIDNATIILDDLVITGTAYGVFVETEGLSLASTTTNLVITRCSFSGQTEACITNKTPETLNPLNGLHIADCYFDASTLTAGGAIYLTGTNNPNTNLEICSSTFITNQTAIYCEICENGTIHDCSFKGVAGAATSKAVLCYACDHFVIKNCVAENMNAGFLIEACSDITLRECEALGQGSGNGFILNDLENITCDQCQALSFNTGFNLTVSHVTINNFTIRNCLASKNSEDGFHSEIIDTGSIQGIITGCKAVGNSSYGFNDVQGALSNITYVNNVARGNALGNYSTTGAPFYVASLIDEPTYWQNVTQ